MVEVSNLSIFGTFSTAIGAITAAGLAAWVTLRLGRRKEKTEIQGALNEGFKILVTELQEERDRLDETVRAQGVELTNLRNELRRAQQRIDSAERVAKHLLKRGK